MNPKSKKCPLTFRPGLALLIAVPLSCSLLSGQESEEEEIFELSPFTVEGSEDQGYYSAQTMAGGRLRTNLVDVATSVQVVTEEMLEDIGATTIDQVLAYTTGTEAFGSMSEFGQLQDGGEGVLDQSQARQDPASAIRVRGLGKPTRTTNYFESAIGFNRYISGRVDVNRGANSFLFGLGSPGGIVNVTVDPANLNKDSVEIRHQISTQGFYDNFSNEISVNANKVLIEDKLAIRFAALEVDNEYMQKPAFNKESRRYAAFKFKPFADRSISLNVNYEEGENYGVPVDRLSPLTTLDTFIDDPYGTVWGSVGDVTNAAGRHIVDPFGNLRAGYPSYLGVDAAGNPIDPTLYDQNIKRNGWASVFDGSTGRTDGLPDIGVYTGWLNGVSEFNPYYNPNGTDLVTNTSVLTRNLYLSDIDSVLLPQYTAYSKQGLIDYDVFDFSRNLISGSIDNTSTEFKRTIASLEGVTENGNYGFELAFNSETSSCDSFVAVSAPSLDIDTNYSFPAGPNELTGDLNPNFGRLYFTAPSADQTLNEDKRQAMRLTAFARVDFEDKFDGGVLSKLGRHNITTLFDESKVDTERLTYRPYVFGNDPDFHLSEDATIFQRQWSGIFYVSDPYLEAFENPNFKMSDFYTSGLPRNTTLSFPAGFEIPLAYVSMGNPAVDAGPATVIDDEYTAVSSYTPQFQASSGLLTRTEVSSQALNLQSYYLDGLLVANLGWRTDRVTEIRNAEPPKYVGGENNNIPILDRDVFTIADGVTTESEQSNFGYGFVLKTPKNWLPEGMSLAAHYGSSSNFTPAPNKFDFWGDTVPGASGETKDYGVTLGLMNNKFVARLNRYESSSRDEQFGGVTSATGVFVNQQSRFFGRFFTHLDAYDRDHDGLFDNPALDANGNGLLDSREASRPGMPTLAQTTELYLAMDDFWNDFASAQAEFNAVPGTADTLASFSSTGGLTDVLADTLDLEAEGYELELTYNPSKQLRLSFNATQQQAVRSNIAPRFDKLLNEWVTMMASTEIGTRVTALGANTLITNLAAEEWATNTWAAFPLLQGTQGQEFFKQTALAGSDNPELSEYNFRLMGNYSFFDGRLKGAKMGGAYRWSDATAIGYAQGTGVMYPDIISVELPVVDVTRPYYGENKGMLDLWFGYGRKVFNDRAKWSVQLNVRNVLADSDPIVVQVQPDGTPARTMAPAVREWSLSNTISF